MLARTGSRLPCLLLAAATSSCALRPAAASCAWFGSSGRAASEQQQRQQGPGARPTINEQAQEASKAFLTNSLNMEELWMSAVAGKLKIWSARQMQQLKGTEQDIVARVRDAYLDTLARAAAGRVLSNRARTQLKQVCLAVATHNVLLEVAPEKAKDVDEHIADSMGGLYAPFMLGGLKLSSWAKRLLLRHSSISQAVDTLHTIAKDMEGACHCSVQPLSCSGDSDDDLQLQQQQVAPQQQQQQQQEDPAAAAEAEARQHHTQHQWSQGAALTVDSCMVAEVLHAEGLPQLLRHFCCQHNMSWLRVYEGQGVEARLEACIGHGDSCCRMTVAPSGTRGD